MQREQWLCRSQAENVRCGMCLERLESNQSAFFNLKIQHCVYSGAGSFPSLVQWVKNPVLLQTWHRSQLRFEFCPWPGNFHILWVWQKKKLLTQDSAHPWQFLKGEMEVGWRRISVNHREGWVLHHCPLHTDCLTLFRCYLAPVTCLQDC